MSNMDWMRGNFKKTPGYVCPPGKKDFPSMSFHSTAAVKGYADGGKTLPPGSFASKEDEEKKDWLPSLGEVLQGVALLSIGARMADGGSAKDGKDKENDAPSKYTPYVEGGAGVNEYGSSLGGRVGVRASGEPNKFLKPDFDAYLEGVAFKPHGQKGDAQVTGVGATLNWKFAEGGEVKSEKYGRKNFPEMSFHNTPAVKGYADGQSVSDNGFFASLLRRTSTKDTGQEAAPIEDRVKEREEQAVKTQNTTNDLLNTLSKSKSNEKVNTAPAVSSEYRASKDSQNANADPDGKYTVAEYKANKEKIDDTNQRKANNDKRTKALDEEKAKREQDEIERLKKETKKPADNVSFVSTPTANISPPVAPSAAPIVTTPVVAAPATRPYVPTSAASVSAPIESKPVKTESAPKVNRFPVKLVGNRFEYPADKVIDPYDEGSSGDGVKGYPLANDDPRWKLPIPKN